MNPFEVLGACCHWNCGSDWLRAGTLLSIKVVDDCVWVMRSDTEKLGMLPSENCAEYLSLPQEDRFTQVSVIRDVNLGSKYGQLFVAPVR